MKHVFISLICLSTLILTLSLCMILESQKDRFQEWYGILEFKKKDPNIDKHTFDYHSSRMKSALTRLNNTQRSIHRVERFALYFSVSFVAYLFLFRKKLIVTIVSLSKNAANLESKSLYISLLISIAYFVFAIYIFMVNPFRNENSELSRLLYITWDSLGSLTFYLILNSMLILLLTSLFIIPNLKATALKQKSIVLKLFVAYLIISFIVLIFDVLENAIAFG